MSNSGTTVFPATLDGFTGLTTANREDEVGNTHVAMHNQDQAAVLALETTIGTTAGTGVLTNFVAGNLAARTANETFGTPTLQDGTAGTLTLEAPISQNPTIGTPDILDGTAGTLTVNGGILGTPAITDGTATNVRTVPGIGTATDGATVTFDLAVNQTWDVTLGDNRTLAISNETAGQYFVINLKQDGTGERTVTWFSTIYWVDDTAPTLGTAANNVDSYGFLCTGTDTYRGYIIGEGLDET